MKVTNFYAFIITTIFSTTILFSQSNITWKKENFPGKENEFNIAYKAYQSGENIYWNGGPQAYEGALELYLVANLFNPENDLLNFHIGHIYFALHHPHDAEAYYEKAIKLNPKLREQILYELAVSYHQDGAWDNAIAHYNEYRAFLNEGGHKYINMHENDIAHELKYIDLCINQCETAKILTHDTIPIIYENLTSAINTKYPEYSAVVNHNEDLLIFVSSRPNNKDKIENKSSAFDYEDVYFSRRGKFGWGSAQPLHGELNTNAHEAPVWLSGDGTKLLLYYNKSKKAEPSKQGDIYESNFVDNKWTEPSPMTMINSEWRETHASMSNDGKTIYFTTNNPKYAKHGGMDIVKTVFDSITGKWSEPLDIGSKINTEWDEESPFIKPDGNHFYFSSQGHTSIGGFDFFKCILNENGIFSEPINMGFPLNTPYDDAFIYISDDGKRVFFNSNRVGGYGSSDIYEGYILSEINIPVEIEVLDAETKEIIKDAIVDLKITNTEPIYKEKLANNGGKYSIYIGISKSIEVFVEAPNYKPQTLRFNTQYQKVLNFDTVTIKHTVFLNKNYDPLVFSGQLFDNITKNPVDGIVEITIGNEKIAHLTTVNSNYTATIPMNKEYTVTSLAKGHMPFREIFILSEKTKVKDFYLDRIKVGDRFAMRNIQFQTGKAAIQPESITELEILKELLIENPYIKVEVSAHTDITGSLSYNMKLSIERAKTIYTWLIKNDIAKERITFKGYGPKLPIADNNTTEGRILNRRAEIKIIEDH